MDPWRELDEIEEIEFDYIEELMQEPADGYNHGRARTMSGGWHTLETPGHGIPSYKRPVEPRKHGTAYTYRKRKCRCSVCRAWKAADNKKRRKRDP